MNSSTKGDLCGWELKMFQENRWFAVGLEYLNKKAKKYRVSHESRTQD